MAEAHTTLAISPQKIGDDTVYRLSTDLTILRRKKNKGWYSIERMMTTAAKLNVPLEVGIKITP